MSERDVLKIRIPDEEAGVVAHKLADTIFEALENAIHEAMEDAPIPLEKIFIAFAVSGELNPREGKDISCDAIMAFRTLAGQHCGSVNQSGLDFGLRLRRELDQRDSWPLYSAIMDGLLGKTEAAPDAPTEG